ncbi:hypothetical protein KR084_007317, partial [Drosophila pseudotakahashii]
LEIVETLRRNLRPEIRHELLNVPILSVAKLREVCRRRENFLEEVRKNQPYQRTVPFRKQVAELIGDIPMDDALEFTEEEISREVGAVALICFNCRKEGHRHKDCVEQRKVFYRVVIGLLDTGAAINAIGGNLAKQVILNILPFKKVFTVACTADGKTQEVVGRFKTPVTMKTFWSEMKQLQSHIKEINALEDPKADPRPFVAVQLMEQLVKGLLDSGAAVSCLGGNLAQEFLPNSINFKKIAANVSTADGNKQEIVGKVRLPVCYDKST